MTHPASLRRSLPPRGRRPGYLADAPPSPPSVEGYGNVTGLAFIDDSDKLAIADHAGLSATAAFSVAVRARTTLNNPSARYLFGKFAGGNAGFHARINADGSLTFAVGNGTTTGVATTASGVWSDDAQHHVVCVFDGAGSTDADRGKIYLDNVSLALTFSVAFPAACSNTAVDLEFGNATNAGTKFVGQIFHPGYWSEALSTASVESDYSFLRPTTNLQGWWQLSEGTGTSAANFGATGAGTITGARWTEQEELLNLTTDGTFTRSTEGSYHTDADSILYAATNTRRLENMGGGYGALVLLEGARENIHPESQDVNSATWTAIAFNCRDYADNAAISPSGATDAGRFESDGGAPYSMIQGQPSYSTALGVPYTVSVWLKYLVNTGAHVHGLSVEFLGGTAGGAPFTNFVIPPAASWTRIRGTWTQTGTPTYFEPHVYIAGLSQAAADDDLLVYGFQVEAGGFASSAIRTDGAGVTRTADSLTIASGSVPARMKSGRWYLFVQPEFSSASMATGNIFTLVGWNAAGNDLRIENLAGVIRVRAYLAGVVVAESDTLTWSADQVLAIVVDSQAATIEVRGATTGDGVGAVGTSWTMPDGTMRIGGVVGADTEAFCRFGPKIYAA